MERQTLDPPTRRPRAGAPTRAGWWTLAIGLAGLWAATVAAQEPPALAECDATPPFEVLRAEAEGITSPARATWLDGRRLLWPGQPPEGEYLLHHTGAPWPGILGRTLGDTVLGVGLERATGAQATVPPAFAYLGPGVVLTVPATVTDERLRAWHRKPLEVVRFAERKVAATAALQAAAALDDLFAGAIDAPDLGAIVHADRTTFRLWAPTATAVSLCLYPTDAAPAAALHALARDDATGLWSLARPERLAGRYYTYLVDVAVPGIGRVRNRVTDPYSASLGADSKRSFVADLDDPALAPTGWSKDQTPRAVDANPDLVVYELHVRDFSIADASVPVAHRGKYLAFAENDSVGMNHLRALAGAGVTDVHLLPVFDYATVPEAGCTTPAIERPADPASEAPQAAASAVAATDCFNWGYDPLHFNAPEGGYASDAHDGATRIREFRAMVLALHRAGLRVGMDVVYNHMSASGQDPRSVLDRIVPGYYHRLDGEGAVTKSTCCANTATEHAMMARLMLDSAEHWVRHFHVDSFRFDLMGHQPRPAMEALQARVDRAAGRRVPLLGEGWNFGEVADGARFVQASQLSLNGSGIGTFSDRARDAVRGGGPADSGTALFAANAWAGGFAPDADPRAMGQAADWIRAGLAGSLHDYRLVAADGVERPLSAIDYKGQPAGYVAAPGEVVNYVENHDNQTLFDLLALKLPVATPPHERARAQLLAAATTAFSQGVAYFHAGLEVLRSKSLDRNSYDSGDWFNRLDYTGADNGWGRGLPPKNDNGRDWALLAPRLGEARVRVGPDDVAFMRGAFLDLLRIRAGSTLFRLPRAEDVAARLTFPNAGAGQDPRVIAGHLDGRGLAGAGFAEVLYLLNAAGAPRTLVLPREAGKRYVLHPVHRADLAVDRRAREATYAASDGTFVVPARTAVVFVVEGAE